MSRKIYCKNKLCKYYGTNDTCKTTVKIGYGGKCSSFEKGFVYYFNRVWDEIAHSNMIPINMLDDDLRMGIYFVCKTYDIGFSETELGTWRFLVFKDGSDGEPLKYEDIITRDMNTEEFKKLYHDFVNGNLPQIEYAESKKVVQPFGWLSPLGEFIEGDFGEHERAARKIITEKNMLNEFKKWKLARDFLIEVKGYCLIHNPSGDGGYIVSHTTQLAKKQKDFLYGYFIDMGDRFKAEKYIDEH